MRNRNRINNEKKNKQWNEMKIKTKKKRINEKKQWNEGKIRNRKEIKRKNDMISKWEIVMKWKMKKRNNEMKSKIITRKKRNIEKK